MGALATAGRAGRADQAALVNRCLGLRPETDDLISLASTPERMLIAGIKTALRDLARRWKALDAEIKGLKKQIEALVRTAAPDLVELHGVGVEIAGQFLVTAGDNAERIHSEAAFAKLRDVAPQPAGRLHRIGVGRTHAGTYVRLLIQDLDITIINATTGEILRELTLDPTRDYQPRGKQPTPQTSNGPTFP